MTFVHAESANLDEAFVPLATGLEPFLAAMGEINDPVAGVRMRADEITIETPVEVDLAAAGGECHALGVVPPLYPVEVGIEPVLHRLRFTLVLEPVAE